MITPLRGPLQPQPPRAAAAQKDADPQDRFTPSQDESFCDVAKALPAAFALPLEQTYEGTKQFIHDHPFFHHGLMDLPIGGGKHFRNVPFIGPGRFVVGVLTLNGETIAKGVQTTKGTWDAD